jgi:hypothetical protein
MPLGQDRIKSMWWFGTFVAKYDFNNIEDNGNVTQNHIEVN